MRPPNCDRGVTVTCNECAARIASMSDGDLLELTKNPNYDAYTWLREHVQDCKNPECQRRCHSMLDLQSCTKLSSMPIEEILKSPDYSDVHAWIREHLRRCKIRECGRLADRLLDFELERLPPEKRRLIERGPSSKIN